MSRLAAAPPPLAPAAPASTGPLAGLAPADRERFRAWGWGPLSRLPVDRIDTAVVAAGRRGPDAVAVIDRDGRSLTYRRLLDRADRVARVLVAHGVTPGDRVGVFCTRSADWVVAILACLRSGAAWVPQDVRISPAAHLRHVVDVARLGVVLTTADCRHLLPDLPSEVVVVDQCRDADWPAPDGVLAGLGTDGIAHDGHTGRGSGDVAVVIFTSGTTGVPNGVEVTHANLVNTIVEGPAALGVRPGMRVAQLLNIAFDMAVWEVLGALCHGATLVIRGRDLEATAARADVVIATPSILGRLDPRRCRRVRTVAVAGERCPSRLATAWAATTRFHNSCGPTEVTIVNTVHRVGPDDRLTIGSPLPNTTVYVLDDDRRPVGIGAVGEMWAGGACVTRGYLGNPDLTAQRYRPDPFVPGGRMFRTRDLVSWTPDGRLLHHGRTDDQVKVRGFRVELDGVTAALEQAGAETATTLLHDGRLVAFVTPTGLDVEVVRARAAEELPYYAVPDQVRSVEVLPLTARGKVDRSRLRDRVGTDTAAVA